MSEIGWLIVFIVFIVLIIIIWYAFSGSATVVNNGTVGTVGAVNNGVMFQPGVGFVASNGNGTVVGSTGGNTWSSGMIIVAIIVFFIIIALVIWAVYPRRPVVAPPVLPPPPPIYGAPGPAVNVTMPVAAPPPIEYHHYIEAAAPPPPTVYAAPPPVAAPVVSPVVSPVAAPVGRVGAAAGVDPNGIPYTVSRQVSRGQDYADPDPQTQVYTQPGYDQRGTFYHDKLGVVTGTIHRAPKTVVQTTDYGNHPVNVVGGRPGYIGARPYTYRGTGVRVG